MKPHHRRCTVSCGGRAQSCMSLPGKGTFLHLPGISPHCHTASVQTYVSNLAGTSLSGSKKSDRDRKEEQDIGFLLPVFSLPAHLFTITLLYAPPRSPCWLNGIKVHWWASGTWLTVTAWLNKTAATFCNSCKAPCIARTSASAAQGPQRIRSWVRDLHTTQSSAGEHPWWFSNYLMWTGELAIFFPSMCLGSVPYLCRIITIISFLEICCSVAINEMHTSTSPQNRSALENACWPLIDRMVITLKNKFAVLGLALLYDKQRQTWLGLPFIS